VPLPDEVGERDNDPTSDTKHVTVPPVTVQVVLSIEKDASFYAI